MPKKAKSKAQARFFGAIAGGAKPYSGGEGLSAHKAGEMVKGTKMSELPEKKKKKHRTVKKVDNT